MIIIDSLSVSCKIQVLSFLSDNFENIHLLLIIELMVELTDELITHSAEFQHDISLEVLPRYVSNSTCSFFLVFR